MVMSPLFLALTFFLLDITNTLQCWQRFGSKGFRAEKHSCPSGWKQPFCYTERCPGGVMKKSCTFTGNWCHFMGKKRKCPDGTDAICQVCQGDMCNSEGEHEESPKTREEYAFKCHHQRRNGEISEKTCEPGQKLCASFSCNGRWSKGCSSNWNCNGWKCFGFWKCTACNASLCNGAGGGPVVGGRRMALLLVMAAMLGNFIVGSVTYAAGF